MKTMILISVLVALAGVAGAIIKEKKLPESISGMVFTLKGNWKWLWTIWLWAVSFTIGIPTIDALPDNVKFLGFLMMAGLVFTGAVPLFEKNGRRMHYACAIAAGILSQVCVAMIEPWCLLVWLTFAGYMGLLVWNVFYKKDYSQHWYDYKGVFLAEVLCFVGLVTACLVG